MKGSSRWDCKAIGTHSGKAAPSVESIEETKRPPGSGLITCSGQPRPGNVSRIASALCEHAEVNQARFPTQSAPPVPFALPAQPGKRSLSHGQWGIPIYIFGSLQGWCHATRWERMGLVIIILL